MPQTLCSARLADQQTHCTEFARPDSSLCTTHIRERERSVREYKLAGERAETLRPQAILTLAALKSIQPAQADDARKATEIYLEAVKEEARLRAAHTKRFYADGPIEGHHWRVDFLMKTVANGMPFVDELRKRGSGRANAAEGRPRIHLRPRIRREEPDWRVYQQPPHADRAWQKPPQPYYSSSAPSSSGDGGGSFTVFFFMLVACYFVYLLLRGLRHRHQLYTRTMANHELSREVTTWTKAEVEKHNLPITPPPPAKDLPPTPIPGEFPRIVPANANGIVVDLVTVETTDGHTGTGWVIGIGEDLDITGSALAFHSWRPARTTSGYFVGTGAGEIITGAYGCFDWN